MRTLLVLVVGDRGGEGVRLEERDRDRDRVRRVRETRGVQRRLAEAVLVQAREHAPPCVPLHLEQLVAGRRVASRQQHSDEVLAGLRHPLDLPHGAAGLGEGAARRGGHVQRDLP